MTAEAMTQNRCLWLSWIMMGWRYESAHHLKFFLFLSETIPH